jgi:hypothetical protein
MYEAAEDGKTHINCYSKSKTQLGQFASNFAFAPFECEDGYFASVEAYWYWLGCTDPDKDELRQLFGYKAKQKGRELQGSDWPEVPWFKEKIKNAVRLKFEMNPLFTKMLIKSTLPLVHYYEYGGKVVYDGKSDWLFEFLTELRGELKRT